MSVTSGQQPPAMALPPRPWVLLLVDDEPDILESLQTLIETSLEGTKVLTANSGRRGLEILEEERIDAVVSDFRMPGMDGIEFLVQVRRRHPTLPRVMLTAFTDRETTNRAIVEAVVDEFITKTVEPEVFLQRVSKLLSYQPGAQSPAPGPQAPAR